MKVSPGCSSARNTAWFIWLPEFGWTLAKLRAEQLLGALDRQRLGDVDELAAAVVALARIALGILVGHAPSPAPRARRGETMFSEAISSISCCWRPSSLRDRVGDLGIGLGQRGGEETGRDGWRLGLVMDMSMGFLWARTGRTGVSTMRRTAPSRCRA